MKLVIDFLLYAIAGVILMLYGELKSISNEWSLLPFVILILIIIDWSNLRSTKLYAKVATGEGVKE